MPGWRYHPNRRQQYRDARTQLLGQRHHQWNVAIVGRCRSARWMAKPSGPTNAAVAATMNWFLPAGLANLVFDAHSKTVASRGTVWNERD
jgi:hypothetical protein